MPVRMTQNDTRATMKKIAVAEDELKQLEESMKSVKLGSIDWNLADGERQDLKVSKILFL